MKIAFVIISILLLHLSRNPWQIIDPPFYGEEGKIFFLENLTYGIHALWEPYAGYLHLFPRLVAFVLSDVDIANLALCYHLSALVAHLILLYAVLRFSEDFDFINRSLMLLCTILIPHGGEVFLNLPNTVNFLGAVPLLLYLSPATQKVHKNFLDLFFLVLAGLSGPYLMIFLPIMLLHSGRRKTLLRPFVLTSIATALVHIYFLALASRQLMTEEVNFAMVGRTISNLLYPLFLSWLPLDLSTDQTLVLILAGLFLAVRASRKHGIQLNASVSILIAAGLLVWLAALARGLGPASYSHPLENAQRYFWVPYVLISISLVALLSERRAKFWIVGLIFLSGVSSWRLQIPVQEVTKPYFRSLPNGEIHVSVYPSPTWDFQFKLETK